MRRFRVTKALRRRNHPFRSIPGFPLFISIEIKDASGSWSLGMVLVVRTPTAQHVDDKFVTSPTLFRLKINQTGTVRIKALTQRSSTILSLSPSTKILGRFCFASSWARRLASACSRTLRIKSCTLGAKMATVPILSSRSLICVVTVVPRSSFSR